MIDHHEQDEQLDHRDLDVTEEPFDAANQSLSDALKASFGVLKAIMAVLVVLYVVSNVRSISAHEQALVLRFGHLQDDVHDAGLMWAMPFPVDEIVPLPTRKSNQVQIDSHTFRRRPDEIGRPLSRLRRGGGEGLDPSVDHALLTADTGLVHVQWKVTYKFGSVRDYVSVIQGYGVEAAEALIRTFIETVGIRLATELTAEEIIRTRVDYVQQQMKLRVNERLVALACGVEVTTVEMFEPTPPLQIRQAFDNTQRAESRKTLARRNAEKASTDLLSKAAGASQQRLSSLFREIDRGGSRGRSVADIEKEISDVLDTDAEGEAGKLLKQAGAYRAEAVARMENDVNEYRVLLPEYKRNPQMLINRLWQQTREYIFQSPGVSKIYRPDGISEFKLLISLDPEERRFQEEQRVQKKSFDDLSTLRPEKLVPLGWDFD